jgi:hypothetical protein
MMLFAIGIKNPSTWRFKAIMTPMRANIVGPPEVALGRLYVWF